MMKKFMAIPAVVLALGACLPDPQSVEETRHNFNREKLGSVILPEMPRIPEKRRSQAIWDNALKLEGTDFFGVNNILADGKEAKRVSGQDKALLLEGAGLPAKGVRAGDLFFTGDPEGYYEKYEITGVQGDVIQLDGVPNKFVDGRPWQVMREHFAPTERVDVILYYRVLQPVGVDYKIFVHMDGSTRMIKDHFPADGKYPTDMWRKGELVADRFTHYVYSNFQSYEAKIYVGFYDHYRDSIRMRVSNRGAARDDGGDRVLAADLPIRLSN
ncbi:MAG: hypothetical protein GMKNLPBB_00720 [Myxococcota bacterium]|nr:hypothetical protein [Myxococcota bacterium]